MDIATWLPILLSGISMAVSVITYCQNIRHDRKRDTLTAFNNLQHEVLDKINGYTKKQITEISQNPRSPEYKELSSLLARLEHFSVGVNTRVYDRKIVIRMAGIYFVSVYDKLSPLIEKKRTLIKTEKHYDEFERLAGQVRKIYPTKE